MVCIVTKKVYERRFRDLKQTELNGLLRRAKQKKYGFEDVWFEVIEEVVKKYHKTQYRFMTESSYHVIMRYTLKG